MENQRAVRVLESTRLFGDLDQASLVSLAAVCTQRTYGRGQYLWYQGDQGDRLVIICTGSVKVVVTSEQGDEVVLVTLGPNETLGELAVLDGSPRSASVVTIEPTTVLNLGRQAALKLLAQEPAVLTAVLRSLGDLIRRLTEQTSDLVFLDLGGRLAKQVLRLANDSPQGHGPIVLDTGQSQSDLASMVGATRPAVNRALQVLANRGLLTVQGQVLILRDLPGLHRRAGWR
jgi:CRP/FNR family cyclic AMP-dependent transcriptional regulator